MFVARFPPATNVFGSRFKLPWCHHTSIGARWQSNTSLTSLSHNFDWILCAHFLVRRHCQMIRSSYDARYVSEARLGALVLLRLRRGLGRFGDFAICVTPDFRRTSPVRLRPDRPGWSHSNNPFKGCRPGLFPDTTPGPESMNKLLLKGFCFTVGALALAGLAGCALVLPPEIKKMERESRAGAAQLKKARPEAFRNFTVGSQTMHYVEVTDQDPKPLILFVHGSPGDWSGWVRFLNDPELQRKAHMIAVDRPGFGASGRGHVERSLARQCADIAPLLDHASPGRRVIVVGHSFGGPVAARLAMDYTPKITDLVILAGSIDPGQEQTRWYQYVADWPVVDWILPGDLVVANREIRALKPELTGLLTRWTNVTQRVSVIQGLNDNLVPAENADFAQRMLTRPASLNIIRIPNMNHFLPWTQYDVVKSEILKHLQ